MKCDEIFAALAMLEKERGIPQDFMMGKIIQALTAAYKKDHEGVENVIVDVNEEKKDLRMYVQKEIVEEVENPGSQISLEDARAMSAKYQLGGVVNIPVKNVEFGRIAAGNGKQVIIQGLREAEHGMIYDEWGSKEHEILTGTVHRIDPRGTVHLRIGSGNEATEGLMGSNEQVPGEVYTEGETLQVYIVDVVSTERGPRVMISRTHPGLVKRMFELEVPEIYDGTVEVKAISREAGARTKLAVWSKNPDVDPVGACIGARGVRVEKIVQELNGEKIDIICWDENPAIFIKNALSPSEVIAVDVDLNEKSAFVVVPDYQLSLAIGKKGQNARLAAKLTGYKIDIKSESQAEEMGYFSEENDDYKEPEQEEAFDNIDDIVDGSYEESLEQQDTEKVKEDEE